MKQGKNEIVFIAGLGATGSSAVVDLLKEVKSYFVFESEFRLFVDPGGLINLRNALVENWSIYQTDIAIKNFLIMVRRLNTRFISPYSILGHSKHFDKEFIIQSKKYIDRLLDFEYRGLWYGIDTLLKRQLNKYSLFYRNKFITEPIYVGKKLSDKDFNQITNDYIKSLINYCIKKNQKQHFCFNENFSSMYPFKILNMAPNAKMLVVLRNPKDVFATLKNTKFCFIPEKLSEFIKWELAIYNRWIEIEKEIKKRDPNGMTIKIIIFEDLISNYDQLVPELFEFLNVQEQDHVLKKNFLKPQVSIKNVGLWRKVLSKDEIAEMDKVFVHIYNRYNKFLE